MHGAGHAGKTQRTVLNFNQSMVELQKKFLAQTRTLPSYHNRISLISSVASDRNRSGNFIPGTGPLQHLIPTHRFGGISLKFSRPLIEYFAMLFRNAQQIGRSFKRLPHIFDQPETLFRRKFFDFRAGRIMHGHSIRHFIA